MAFDISQARSRFPALNQEHIFLDNAGMLTGEEDE